MDWITKAFADPQYDRSNPNCPTLLKLSYTRPHYPYFTPREKFEYYLNRVEPFLDQEVFDHPFLSTRQVRPGEDASVREIRRATAAYYGMVEEIDEDYGTILDHLRHIGQDLDDWIIIYCSDHGEMLGEHGIWEKQKFFEASARVPLIIRWPRRFQPRVVEENVNLCDLFATLCDIADIPLPPPEETVKGAGLDSRSLVPLMEGDSAEWHARFADETISQFGGTNLMIKRGTLKYQLYERKGCTEAPEVLFDLNADPGETRNHLDNPAHAQALAAFRSRTCELGFGPNADPDYRNAGYR
jgi:choline-sulfatase